MCGRFTLRTPAAAWIQEFLPLWSAEDTTRFTAENGLKPRYNIAPTQSIACVRTADDGDHRDCSMMRWGLLPPWAKELSIGNRMINARSETVHEKRSFKHAFQKRRCLIPADGYFEWMKTPDGKQPFLIRRPDQGLLAMAGLWETNKHCGGEAPLHSVTILTTAANETTKHIHDRMPVFLDAEHWDRWLSSDDETSLHDLLRPADNDLLEPIAVSKTVNSPRNDSPACVQPIDDLQPIDDHRDSKDANDQHRDEGHNRGDDESDQPSLF